jgi:hypothetical protein
MKNFDQVSDEEISDAAFFAGLLTPGSRLALTPLPVKVDGLPTIAFCVRAEPIGYQGQKILHPIALIPHRSLLIQDIRNGNATPISRTRILPLDVRHAKLHRAALENPNVFFGVWADEAALKAG